MKQYSFLAAMAIAAMVATSCGKNEKAEEEVKAVPLSEKTTISNRLDSVSYALGVSMGENMNMQVQMGRLPVDSAFVDDFIKGVSEGMNASADKKREAYVYGLQIGQYLTQQKEGFENEIAQFDSTIVANPEKMLTGFVNGFKKKDQAMTAEDAGTFLNNLFKTLQEKSSAGVIEEGKAFLAAKEKEDGIQKTQSGLLYKVVKQGNGARAKESDKVKVHYEGRLIDGTVFDSSLERGEPVVFSPNGVIPGFKEALLLMPVGSEWEVYIPQNLAYGERDMGKIKPYSTLIFKIQLLGIEK